MYVNVRTSLCCVEQHVVETYAYKDGWGLHPPPPPPPFSQVLIFGRQPATFRARVDSPRITKTNTCTTIYIYIYYLENLQKCSMLGKSSTLRARSPLPPVSRPFRKAILRQTDSSNFLRCAVVHFDAPVVFWLVCSGVCNWRLVLIFCWERLCCRWLCAFPPSKACTSRFFDI